LTILACNFEVLLIFPNPGSAIQSKQQRVHRVAYNIINDAFELLELTRRQIQGSYLP